MKFARIQHAKRLLLLTSLLIGSPLLADEKPTPEMTKNYQDCLTQVAIQFAGQQVNDACFIHFNQFINGANPAIAGSKNVTVLIDETHYNFHKKEARYKPFSMLVENDGYTVTSITSEMGFTATLQANQNAILVIANPLHFSNAPDKWSDPIISAFTDKEIGTITDWVKAGGSLMLIADHYPFPGAVDKLAQRFGFFMDNGYNFDPNYNYVFLNALLNTELAQAIMRQEVTVKDLSPKGGTIIKDGVEKDRTIKDDLVDEVRAVMVMLGARVNSLLFWAGSTPTPANGFAAGDGELLDHPIIRGLNPQEAIPFVTSFTGQSFIYQAVPGNGEITNLMALGDDTYTLNPRAQDAYFGIDRDDSENNLVTEALTYQKVPKYTAVKKNTSDSLQGAVLNVGQGKLAVFGEAGMFTAQIASDGKSPMGFNNSMAQYNQQFILNTMHWLDGTLTDENQSDAVPSNTGLKEQLLEDVINVAAAAQAAIDDGKARDIGIINDHKSYAQEYKESYIRSGSGSGCSTITGVNTQDPTLPLLVLVALGYLFIPRRRQS